MSWSSDGVVGDAQECEYGTRVVVMSDLAALETRPRTAKQRPKFGWRNRTVAGSNESKRDRAPCLLGQWRASFILNAWNIDGK